MPPQAIYDALSLKVNSPATPRVGAVGAFWGLGAAAPPRAPGPHQLLGEGGAAGGASGHRAAVPGAIGSIQPCRILP